MKIEINNVTLDTDTLTDEQREQIIAALAEKPKGFRPERGERYEYLDCDSCGSAIWENDGLDNRRLACGNVHPVGRGEYPHRRRIAVKAMWNYVEREVPFVPDWASSQQKCFVAYNHREQRWRPACDIYLQSQFDLPYVSVIHAERFRSENADNLAVIAEGVDKWGV